MGCSKPKLIAFYLPQFHSIKENDEWWGKGFSDWVNVRKAKPLFKHHRQPRAPSESLGYYDPTDIRVMEAQSNLARSHGIYGFCFYHYWFNGKLLLEKPVENFLKLSKPDMPFCLCWANEPWTRAWDGRGRDVIMPQRYGSEEDWRAHFYYLLPAFKDPRAIKADNKPVFLIYRVSAIRNVNEMIKLWQKLARQSGLPGLHIVSMLTSFSDSGYNKNLAIDATCEFFPTHLFRPKPADLFWGGFKMGLHLRILKRYTPFLKNRAIRVDYNYIWQRGINVKKLFHTQYRGVFVAWDNSPRKGTKGVIMHNATPERYSYWLEKQLARVTTDHTQEPFVFLNAWNEWAEGAYMEPDNIFGHGFLEATRKTVSIYDSSPD